MIPILQDAAIQKESTIMWIAKLDNFAFHNYKIY